MVVKQAGAELAIRLPPGYPGLAPLSVYARLPADFNTKSALAPLNQARHNFVDSRQSLKLNGALREYIASLPLNEPQVESGLVSTGNPQSR